MKDASDSKAFNIGSTSLFQPSNRNTEIVLAVSSASGKHDGATIRQPRKLSLELLGNLTPSDDTFLLLQACLKKNR